MYCVETSRFEKQRFSMILNSPILAAAADRLQSPQKEEQTLNDTSPEAESN